ncbi:MAG: phosphoribosylglycinamide formyltransferase [Fibrobacter sp.]|nr:phosphoribosylglycinamide formyltransferase [Fibrobacter sp.]
MFRFGAFASGGGSNFRSLLSHAEDGTLEGSCEFLIVNNKDCGAAQSAREHGIPVYHISSKTHPVEADYEQALLNVLKEHPVDLVALCGYMKKIPDSFLDQMKDRVLNVHPALLPKYGGKGFYGIRVHQAVIAAGEKESGPTIHLVTSEIDSGRTLAQVKVPVLACDKPEALAARVLVQEHALFWKTLRDYARSL